MDLVLILLIIAIIFVTIAIIRKYNKAINEQSNLDKHDDQIMDDCATNDRYDIYKYNDTFFRFRDQTEKISNLDFDISDQLNQIKDSSDHFGEKISDIYDKLTYQKK